MCVASLLASVLLARGASTPKAVIFFLVDDWGSYDAAWKETELGRSPQLQTPHLDALAEEGIKLDQYYVQHICTPTRSTLMSGRYQIHTGLQDGIIQNHAKVCLPPKFKTMGNAFQEMGFSTHMVGKWHNGIFKDSCLPWNRGFDSYYGYLTGSELHYTKQQRSPRGKPDGKGTMCYPDFRTENGPINSTCIHDPFAPPPPPPIPCGPGSNGIGGDVALALLPKCNYTTLSGGAVAAGHDVSGYPKVMTVDEAEEACDTNDSCLAITFRGAVETCSAKPATCKIYLKTSTATNGDGAWNTLYKHPQPKTGQGVPGCYSTHMFMDQVQKILSEHAAEAHNNATSKANPAPLFLYLALQDVHEPVAVPAQYSSIYEGTIMDNTRRNYAGMVSVVDEAVGNLTRSLKKLGMWNDTVLVVSNDNGGWRGYGGINYPYRGHKTTLWEGGIRGIGTITAPGRITPGTRTSSLMHVSDWLPTLVTAGGGNVADLGSGFSGLDGIDQWHYLSSIKAHPSPSAAALPSAVSVPPPRNEILHNIEGVNGTGAAVLRVGDFKLLHNMAAQGGFTGWCDVCSDPKGCSTGGGALVPQGGQLCCNTRPMPTAKAVACAVAPAYKATSGTMLFNIIADPSEANDLAINATLEHADVIAKMLARLKEHNATNVPCCVCTGSGVDGAEMKQPPKDGYWSSFHDQSENKDPNCALQAEPPPSRHQNDIN